MYSERLSRALCHSAKFQQDVWRAWPYINLLPPSLVARNSRPNNTLPSFIMVYSIALLLAGASIAVAGGVNRSLPLPPGSRTSHAKGPKPQATDEAVTGAAAVYGINDDENTNGGLGCRAYYGDGTGNDGWPTIDQWVSFNYIWQVNYNTIQSSCSQYGVPNNSDDEMDDMVFILRS